MRDVSEHEFYREQINQTKKNDKYTSKLPNNLYYVYLLIIYSNLFYLHPCESLARRFREALGKKWTNLV